MKPSHILAALTTLVLVVMAGGLVLMYRGNSTVVLPVDYGKYTEVTAQYEINATYATSTPLRMAVSAEADDTAVATMKKFVTDTISEFKNGVDSLLNSEAGQAAPGADAPATLSIHYVMSDSPKTRSYIFTVSEYMTGAAHPGTYFKTFTFSNDTGAALRLSDLFVPDVAYLDTLSAISRARLPKILGESYVESDVIAGTAAEVTNFENFFLDEKSLVVLFPPYQVAAYAAGSQTLAIPRSELVSILQFEYE